MNGAAFLADIEQALAATLLPGGLVALGNLPARRTAAVRAIEGMWDAVGSALAQVSPDTCADPVANSDYPRSA